VGLALIGTKGVDKAVKGIKGAEAAGAAADLAKALPDQSAKVIGAKEVNVYSSYSASPTAATVKTSTVMPIGEVASATKGAGEARLYSHLEDPVNVGAGQDFTAIQKRTIIEENMNRNGGVVRSDLSGEELVKPSKSQRGVTPPKNEWQIDHIDTKVNGGSNSYSNAQVLSREENRNKWYK